MRAAGGPLRPVVTLAALALAACAPGEPELTGPGGAPVSTELTALDRLTVQELRLAGDDPFAARPVEHILLPAGPTDPAGLGGAMDGAGFGVPEIEVRPGFETRLVVLSDSRAETLGRQIGWLEANAPTFGYRHATWTTRAVAPEGTEAPTIE